MPVRDDCNLRMDLVVPGLSVHGGLPLFCDVTVVSPITHQSFPRSGTSNAGGRLLERAQADNNTTYASVIESGLGSLLCLGFEVFGRWGPQCIELIPKLAHAKSHGLHPRLRRGSAHAYQTHWTGLISVALMKAVATAVLRQEGCDLGTTLVEPIPCLAD